MIDAELHTEIGKRLGLCDSYSRTEAMVYEMLKAPSPADRVKVFLDWANICDAPWPWRSIIADILRLACAKVVLADLLELDERTFYDSLPDVVPVWRGCERGRERGLSWTTDPAVASGFATGRRCFNKEPTILTAEIPKPHIFAVFTDRNESEIVLDPRRLRKLQLTT